MRSRSLFLFGVGLSLLARSLAAQPSPDDASMLGYAIDGDTTTFIFDSALYDVTPTRVVVTGAFRGWSQDMDDPTWHLVPHPDGSGVWTLSVSNPGFRLIGPSTPFKYRVDDGAWLEPPAAAPNSEGGNLVFLHGLDPPRLRAELRGARAVWATVTGAERPLDASAYRLTTAQGEDVPIAEILPYDASQTLVVPAADLDVRRVYYLELPGGGLRTRVRFDGLYRTLYSAKPLGATVEGGQTTFRFFSPRAERMTLFLYDAAGAEPGEATETVELARDSVGVWEATLPRDLHGAYYDARVYGGAAAQDPGSFFYETHPTQISDPYALVQDEAWGKSRVWRDDAPPPPPVAGGRPALEDVVAYEVHVQDFTDRLPVPERLKGTFEALATPGLTNAEGAPIGFDYLVDLGINVVHLMPVQEFLHYPDALWQATFGDDAYMIEQGVSEENYQWGYRTTHAFALESRFRTRGTEPGAERDQFRALVGAFHDQGIAVIIDLVPNHTGENMDGRHDLIHWNVLGKPYYYRTDEDVEHIGPFGNEVKFEERPLVQRWLIDQCLHFVERLGVDGFRVDLAGQVDKQTLLALKAALPDDVILYGEPWIPPSDPDVVANPDWAWYKADAPITFFQDDARNAFKGPVSDPEDKEVDRGYAGGDASQRAHAMLGLTNGFPDEVEPNRGINYLDIHDNWALADRFALTDWNGLEGVDAGPFKIAAGLLFTSLGPVVIHGGTEIMRSKGHAPLGGIEKEFDGGVIHFHGKRDTYNLRRANQFAWETVGTRDAATGNDYANMLAYWKGLIDFRMSDAGAVFRRGTVPPAGYYRWILPDDEHLLGYVVDERVLVLINTSETVQTFEVADLPAGLWRLIADAERVDHVNGVDDATLEGDTAHSLRLPPTSLKMWMRE